MTSNNIGSHSPIHIPKTAPSRGLSPGHTSFSTSPPTSHKMPSSRTSPAIRPQSPLSPHFDSATRFEPLRPPSPRNMNARAGNSQRRANTNALKLPSLPRFHPANFPSTQSSLQTTPESRQSPQQHPISPRMHQRVISDAQRHLLVYQRDMISAAARSSTPPQLDNPESPRLAPVGSPGPVTPLQLESEEGDYVMAGTRSNENQLFPPEELMDKLMKEEAARRRASPSRQLYR